MIHLKKTFVVLLISLLGFNLNAQSEEKEKKTPLQKVVIDFEAKPFQPFSQFFAKWPTFLESFGIYLGYELSDKFDIRFNFSKAKIHYKPPNLSETYEKYYTAQLASKYKLFSEFNSIFKSKSNLYLLGKAGIGINEFREQEFFAFDLATRIDFNSAPYFGLGYNYFYDKVPISYNINGFYFTFGFEF